MPDLSMCLNKKCKERYDCYRYMAFPNWFRQTYFMVEAYENIFHKGVCEMRMDVKGSKCRTKSQMEEIERERASNVQNKNKKRTF